MSDKPRSNHNLQTLSLAKKILCFLAMVGSAGVSFVLILLCIKTGAHLPFDNIKQYVSFLVLVVLASMGLWAMIAFGRETFLFPNEQNLFGKIGKWLGAVLLGIALIFWIITVVNPPKQRAKPYIVKSDLHNIYLACKAYWVNNGGDKNCNVDIASQTAYGYIQHKDVSVSGSGTESTFTAKGLNTKGTKTFTVNSIGKITEVDGM